MESPEFVSLVSPPTTIKVSTKNKDIANQYKNSLLIFNSPELIFVKINI